MHTHTLRHYCSVVPAVLLAILLLRWAGAPPAPDIELAPVVGQVSCAGHTPGEMVVFFEPIGTGRLYAYGDVLPNGSFRHIYTLGSLRYEGVMPGRYQVWFSPRGLAQPGASMDRKYLALETTDLLVDVEKDWNYVAFSLH
jgi:hypothetical protein